MPKHGKKYNEAVKNSDLTVYYEPIEALSKVKETPRPNLMKPSSWRCA